MSLLKNKTILLCVTGSIAAYKAVLLLRRLQEEGALVKVVLSKGAQAFITPLTFASLVGKENVAPDIFDDTYAHLEWAKADAIVVAPATANVIASIAHGFASDFMTTTILASRTPLLISPAMNKNMWENFAVQDNVQILQKRRVIIVEPEAGHLACGEEGKGRLADLEKIVFVLSKALTPQSWQGKKALVTAGPTEEDIDPVRVLTNRSSGKMGYALATELARRGAEVILISGPSALKSSFGTKMIFARTAIEMNKEVQKYFSKCDVFFSAAAVADFYPQEKLKEKISAGKAFNLKLIPNPDILAACGKIKQVGQILIGFSLTKKEDLKIARKKLLEKKADIIIANTFKNIDSDQAEVILVTAKKSYKISLQKKSIIAEEIINFVEKNNGEKI